VKRAELDLSRSAAGVTGQIPTGRFNVQPPAPAQTNPMASLLASLMPSKRDVASTLGAPVDALAWAAHRMGAPISGDDSYGGSGLGLPVALSMLGIGAASLVGIGYLAGPYQGELLLAATVCLAAVAFLSWRQWRARASGSCVIPGLSLDDVRGCRTRLPFR
jgi:hypothetical protein